MISSSMMGSPRSKISSMDVMLPSFTMRPRLVLGSHSGFYSFGYGHHVRSGHRGLHVFAASSAVTLFASVCHNFPRLQFFL